MSSKKAPTSPYLAARREWNEQYGQFLSDAKTWRTIAFMSLFLTMLCVLCMVYMAAQNKLIPYIVEVDQKGRTVQVYPASKAVIGNPNIIRAQLAQFIQDVRSVTADKTLQLHAVNRAYTYLSENMPAYHYVNTFFRDNVPFEVAKNKTVVVDIDQVLPLTDRSWRIEWVETTYARNGVKIDTVNMTGTTTIIETGNVNNQTILLNPTGLIIQELSWSKEL